MRRCVECHECVLVEMMEFSLSIYDKKNLRVICKKSAKSALQEIWVFPGRKSASSKAAASRSVPPTTAAKLCLVTLLFTFCIYD